MTLKAGRVATRIPVQDMDRARRFYSEKLGLDPSEERGVVFEEVNIPGMKTVDGIAEVFGNYPSKGGKGERAAWFRDSEGNMIGIGQAIE